MRLEGTSLKTDEKFPRDNLTQLFFLSHRTVPVCHLNWCKETQTLKGYFEDLLPTLKIVFLVKDKIEIQREIEIKRL